MNFCPALEELLSHGHAPTSTLNNLVALRGLMRELRPSQTMEIGLSVGGSALLFCSEHQRMGPPLRQHTALDPYQAAIWGNTGLNAIEQAGLSGYLDFREVHSALGLPKILANGCQFGLIYVDGSHLFEDVFIDAYYSIRLLKSGGVIAFDDSTDPHVAKVISFLRASIPGMEELDLSNYRESGGERWRYRAARLLGKLQLTAFRRSGDVERQWNAPFQRF